MADPYYLWFPGDYHRDTGDLSLLEHGAYRVMLDYYYSNETLPSDRMRLYRLCRASTKDEQHAVDVIADRFFVQNGNGLKNKRADAEIEKRKAFIINQHRKGMLGAMARWGGKDSTGMAVAMPEASPKVWPDDGLPSPSPSPSPDLSPDLRKDLKPKPFARTRAKKPPGPVRGVSWDEKFSGITPEMMTLWAKAYPAVDLPRELYAMDQWLIANPNKRKKNCYRFITNWLSRKQEKSR